MPFGRVKFPHPMGSHRHSRNRDNLRTVIVCILFCIGLVAAIAAAFVYWNQNDFVPDAHPANPVETKSM
jgi:hypothetical protein